MRLGEGRTRVDKVRSNDGAWKGEAPRAKAGP
jgi:hypothetical protein